MRQELYDYDILYFDGEYKEKQLRYVCGKIVDMKNAETKFIYISEIKEDETVLFETITLPYAIVRSIRVLLFDLIDNKIIKRDDSVQTSKQTLIRSKGVMKRNFNSHRRKVGV